ncbi:MAG: cysteine desulfurase family protein [Actinomycetes bacterium]
MASANLIYLDYNATTPLDQGVLGQMNPWFVEQFWNAASSHIGGRTASDAVATARNQVAALIGARPSEIVWTSGATEAINLAIKGVVQQPGTDRKRVVTFATEHKAVLDTCTWLSDQGSPVTVLAVNPDGSIPLDSLSEALDAGDISLVSVMAANNETGVLADLSSVVSLSHASGALVHTDATQLAGKLPFDVADLEVDLASLSAHKLYGPKGMGALFVSRKTAISPLTHGGGHERGMRSGTLNVPGIVGFGAAAQIATRAMHSESDRQRALISQLLDYLLASTPSIEVTTKSADRLPNTVNLRICGADAEAIMANCPELAISSGSACTALIPEASHVLRAMGLSSDEAHECIRISVGRPTTQQNVLDGATMIADAIARVRSFNP